ncbi:hypothetical protein CKN86_11535 [Carnobacterium divergens]|uniref:tetratricopeptide repeat protein n=1 Tax=Carnobacterium divergens TaxID=2748 RepID=UPI000D3F70E9|nr:tetratricopeptide repeat protein [Carnobacterium divergens]MCO6017533.1 tetratricopeptide repeat protein [Carnobacterium divergens]TFI61041.1 hypothetical protein CKN62_11675 [Carnobacterium divergens]TFI88063.1 hypothetical protein CKN84_11565 [Carnobacterium divergens]TFJ02631.1 hypothetical protein CKN86_11535 [Carnobacterium divergens]TFJ04141.1 hypothetical protein CKN65_11575 [Carnobacterium divergens]
MDRNQKAFQLWEQGQPTEAIELLFKEIDTHPENMDSYYNLATMLMLAQKYEDAKAVLTLANEKKANQSKILYGFGNLYYQTADYSQGIYYFSQVFTQSETFKKDAAIMLGQSYLALEQPKKALVYLLTAFQLDETDSELALLLGNVFLQTEAFQEAYTYYDHTSKLNQENSEAWFKKGLMGMVLAKDKEKIEADFQRSQELNPIYYQQNLNQLQEIEAFLQANRQE